MSVPIIALYATPSSGICSTPHSSGHGPVDLDLSSRHSASPASSSKPVVGGLSCLFSSAPPARHASASLCFTGADELGSLRTERSEELGCSYKYSPYSTPVRCRDHSPTSVFQGPASCSIRGSVGGGGSSRSPPSLKIFREDLGSGRERLFGRFVSHALGSCLEYDSPSSPATDSPEIGLSEFNFCMEDSLAVPGMNAEPYAKEMLYGAQSRNKIFHEEIVVKAFYEAEKAHRGQMRASGHPYLQHCVETAILLASVGASTTVVVAGLLHDTLDDSFMNYDYIFRVFGAGVADLVEEVSKLSQLSKLARDNNTATKTAEADRLHTMFLAMADARAVLIKLADRLHNMMTLDALSMIKRQRFAKETLEIFVPLANRLGISSWKEQLENYCFKHLNPEHHRELSSIVADSFDEQMILSAKRKLERALNARGICYYALSGRHKSLYSIYLKMIKKKLAMNEIHDIHGLRLIVDSEDDCYKALDIVRNLWPEVTGRFKDYILEPKFNGYRSLHTVVLSENAVPVEIQIRTKEMHLQAEFGFAAHWRYKEGQGAYSSFILHMVEWARWVLTWQLETMVKGGLSSKKADVRLTCPFPSHLEDCVHSYKHQGDLQDPVFVILLENEKMSVQELPANSSVMDLLDRVSQGSSRWTDIFPTKDELKPKLNHELIVDPNRKLKMGDVVELTPAIPNKSLVECRKEIKRMYDRDLTISSRVC